MYNGFIKLTEQDRRDNTRIIYVNRNLIVRVASVPTGTRLWFDKDTMIDVLETPEQILDITDALVITDKDKTDGRNGNEDGRPSNPAIKPDR